MLCVAFNLMKGKRWETGENDGKVKKEIMAEDMGFGSGIKELQASCWPSSNFSSLC